MFTITTEIRDVFGKKLEKYRKEGKLPAVVYGKGQKTTPLFINASEFKKIWKQAEEASIVTLKNPAKSDLPESVLIYDAYFDPLKKEPMHVDFYAVDMSKPITANVPIVFEGVAPAVKEQGAVLVKVVHEFEVEALPKDFPREIKVDVSKLLKLEDKIHLRDLDLPKNIKVLAKPDMVIILAKPHQEEKAEEVQPVNVADIELSTKKGKKEEEGAEGQKPAEGEEKKPPVGKKQ